jgi:hypothetical protein
MSKNVLFSLHKGSAENIFLKNVCSSDKEDVSMHNIGVKFSISFQRIGSFGKSSSLNHNQLFRSGKLKKKKDLTDN